MDNKQQIRSQWLAKLQFAINDLLKPIIVTQQQRNAYLTPQAMLIWERAFTHETVSIDNSYEDLEYLGDRILIAVFAKYLTQRFPHHSKKEYTELNSAYMGKLHQYELARKMGLPDLVRIEGLDLVILNIAADVFESFFGALDSVSDLIMPGSGYANCYNMVVHLYKDIVIDESRGDGSAKTQTIQMFTRFGLGKVDEIVNEGRPVQVSVLLTHGQIDFLSRYNVILNNPMIGSGVGNTKAEAEAEAYENAFKTLTNMGITSKWAEKAKRVLDFADPNIEPYVPAARRRLEKEGFVEMYFFIPRNAVTKNGGPLQLVGERKDGSRKSLAITYASETDTGHMSAKTFVINKYASGQ